MWEFTEYFLIVYNWIPSSREYTTFSIEYYFLKPNWAAESKLVLGIHTGIFQAYCGSISRNIGEMEEIIMGNVKQNVSQNLSTDCTWLVETLFPSYDGVMVLRLTVVPMVTKPMLAIHWRLRCSHEAFYSVELFVFTVHCSDHAVFLLRPLRRWRRRERVVIFGVGHYQHQQKASWMPRSALRGLLWNWLICKRRTHENKTAS